MEYSTDDKIREVKREIEFRNFVYTKQLKAGKITIAIAQRRLGIMKAILADYERLDMNDLFANLRKV